MYIISRRKWNKSRKNRILSGFLRFFVPQKPADYRNWFCRRQNPAYCMCKKMPACRNDKEMIKKGSKKYERICVFSERCLLYC